MEDSLKTPVYFPGLNSLRFFAAFSVVIAHVELVKLYFGVPNYYDLSVRINFGGIGVYFFFVLSGFLITYLLCVEKQRTSTVAVKQFYLRRIFRIWPLYFLMVTLGFFILPAFHFFDLAPGSFHENFKTNLLFFVLILPNVSMAFFQPVQHIAHLWSIGVEEQFYLFWPLIVKFSKQLLKATIFVTFFYLLFKLILGLAPLFMETGKNYAAIKSLFAMSKFESMMIGAMAAYVLYRKKTKILEIIYKPLVQLLALIVFPFLSYLAGTDNLIQDVIHVPLSVLFAIIVLNVASNPDSLLKLEFKWLNYLGKISYGIYMYHVIIIYILVKLLFPYFNSNPVMANITVYGGATVLSCLIAHLSYYYFEKFFIKLKFKHAPVASGYKEEKK